LEDNVEQENDTAVAPAAAIEQTFNLVGSPEQVAQMFLALANAQGEFTELKKTSKVTVYPKARADGYKPPPYDFWYAPLDKIIEATRPALTKQGLTVTQPPCGGDVVRTLLCHADGGRMETVMYIPQYKDIKDMGGFITYIRRYAQSAILNVAADDDADNNGAPVGEGDPPRREQSGPKASTGQSSGEKSSATSSQPRTSSTPASASSSSAQSQASAPDEGPRRLNQTEKAELTKLVREIHGLDPADADGIKGAVAEEIARYVAGAGKPPTYVVNVNDYKPLHALLFARAVKAKQDRSAEGPQS
jgi:hypothetical protein